MSVPTVRSAKCQENPLVEGSLSNGTFCVSFSVSPHGTCNVDDGGAALEKDYFGRWSVLGIRSFVLGCNTGNAVAGFTNVAMYSDWISNVISRKTTRKILKN
jgi:secreted trypsin-like serine protease